MAVMKIYIRTFGCQMNEADTEIVKAVLKSHNFEFVEEVEAADVVLLNTCSVRENANRKVFGYIHEIKRINKTALMGVLGCMASDLKNNLIQDPKLKIDFIAGPDSYKKLPQIIEQVMEKDEKYGHFDLSEFETYEDIYPLRKQGVNAWVAIMRGCNNFCSYCIVPYTRGRERSRSLQSIVREIEQLVADGYKQITLLGQNVNSYKYEDYNFVDLLKAVSKIKGLKRIRFVSPHPKDFSLDLIKLMAKRENICNAIHLPLQAGSTQVLKRMNRTYTKQEYLELVNKIKKIIPEIVINTDIIVGFCGETEEDFEDTLEVVKKVEFDSAYIFKYSVRSGTLAAKKYVDDVSEEVKTRRIVKLNAIQKRISLKKHKEQIGSIEEVLIERKGTKKSKTDWQGRDEGNRLVIFSDGNYNIGELVKVKIEEATANVVKGEGCEDIF